MNVFELFAKLGLDTKEYDEGLDGAEKKATSFGDVLKKGIGVAGAVTATAITATATATVAGTKAFIDGVSATASYADNIDKMSKKLNMSAEAYQTYSFMFEHAGSSIDTMQASMKTLATAVETGSDAFAQLGITEEQLADLNQEQIFDLTLQQLSQVSDETERTYLAGQLLGRGATELGALLSMSGEEMADLKAQASELGGVLSDEAVESGARFQDSLQNMNVALNGVKNNLLAEFLPSFSTVMDGLAMVFSGDSDKGLGLVEDGVNQLASKLTEVAPTFVQIGGTILKALASAITTNLPVLIESGAEVVSELIGGILDNADAIFEAGEKVISLFVSKIIDPEKAGKFTQVAINLITKLANAISSALPTLIPAIAGVIAEIVRTLTQPENLSALIQCALQLIMALAIGLVDAIPELVSVIPEIVVNIVTALIENTPLILETLLELVGALGMAVFNLIGSLLGMDAQEIQDSITNVFSNFVRWGSDVLQWIKNIGNKIKSGISNFFSNARNNFTNGLNAIRDKVTGGLNAVKEKFTGIFDGVKNTVRNAIEYIKGLFKFDWSLPKIKLPHFSISGSLDLLSVPPKIPSVSIDWYKKAMNQPYLLDEATIFGASGGKLLGGGEAGSELVIGTNKLMNMMKQAVGSDSRPITINVYGAEGQDVRLLAKEVSRELQHMIKDEERAYA